MWATLGYTVGIALLTWLIWVLQDEAGPTDDLNEMIEKANGHEHQRRRTTAAHDERTGTPGQ
jgi:hypothetical protein